MRAAVPEELEDFDPVRGLDRLRRPQFDIVDALDGGTLSVRGKGEAQAAKAAQQTKNHGHSPWGADSILGGDLSDSDQRLVHSVLRPLLPHSLDLLYPDV